MNVRLARDQKINVLNSADVYKVMQQILLRENKVRRGQEHFWVVGLSKTNKIVNIELVGLGATNRVSIEPPEVFRIAIYKVAPKVILVHNHPSGTMAASKADKEFTDHMLKAGRMLNIEVIDHLVISEDAYLSFENEGLMNEIRNNGNYEIVKKERLELQQVRFEYELKKSIAIKLKKIGLDADAIKEATGLKKSEISRFR